LFAVIDADAEQSSRGSGGEDVGASSGQEDGARTADARAARILEEHGDVLWRFVVGRVRSPEIAEDIVQETLLAVVEGAGSFVGASSERTWVLAIASHKIADYFRRARRGAGVRSLSDEDEVAAGGIADEMFTEKGMWAKPLGDWGTQGKGSASENAEVLAALRKCLEGLPPALAEAVWMRDLLGVPTEEVCKVLGLSATNLWSRTHRARSALRACIERSMEGRKEAPR
jgi:RNA polymerase sigma-70 factor, ECF subfamily